MNPQPSGNSTSERESRAEKQHLSTATVSIVLGAVCVIILVGSVWYYLQLPSSGSGRSLLPFPPSQSEFYRLDDVAGHLHRSNTRRTIEWPEHPSGEIEFVTNNLGFREDAPTRIEKPPGVTRILVTGDSHTDGVVFNEESFPNQLERLLNGRSAQQQFEVVNAGVGYYGPQNYSGLAKRFLDLDCDFFVVVLYAGNDFLDAVKIAVARQQITVPERPEGYLEKLTAANEIANAQVAQGLNQAYLFKAFPQLQDLSLRITLDSLSEVDDLAREQGFKLIVVVLPTKFDLEYPAHSATLERALGVLDLDRRDLRVTPRLAGALTRSLRETGIETLNAYDLLHHQHEDLFWNQDYHLSTAGHEQLARVFLAQMEPLLITTAKP